MSSLVKMDSGGKTVWVTEPKPDSLFTTELWRMAIQVLMESICNRFDDAMVKRILIETKDRLAEATKKYMKNDPLIFDLLINKRDITRISIPVNYGKLMMATLVEVILNMDTDNYLIVLDTAEKLGKMMFKQDEMTNITTTYEWLENVASVIFAKQNTMMVFPEITDTSITTHIFKCPMEETAGKFPHTFCPFSYGYLRGLWRAVFPRGDVVVFGTMAHGAPTCHFKLVTVHKNDGKIKEKRIKYLFRKEIIRHL